MESAPNLPDLNEEKISSQFIESLFLTATEYLNSNICSYVWQKYKEIKVGKSVLGQKG